MKEYSGEKIVKAKHILPFRLGELDRLIGMKCNLFLAEPTALIESIAASDNMPVHHGCLFIPHTESDQYCCEMIKKGAIAVLTDHQIKDIPCVVVEDCLTALNRLCELFEKSVDLPSVIVAGSEGKTTTKRMVKKVLEQDRRVFCQEGNYNTLHALCCSLQEVETSDQIIVQEVDESRKDNTVNCSQILKPDIIIVTNIAEAHIARWGGKENLIKSFLGLTAGLKENGYVILNADDADSLNAGFKGNIITVGIQNTAADYLAVNISEKAGGVEFDLLHEKRTTHIRLSVKGEHNVYNAMMAFVVGKLKGVRESSILKGLLGFSNAGIRQNIVKLGGTLVYADCYNASLTSIRYALKCFCSLRNTHGKRIAVIGDIAEIEGYENETYGKIAAIIDQSDLNVIVTYGKSSKMILDKLSRSCAKYHANDLTELIAVLSRLKSEGNNAYLFKASRIMELEKSIKAVFPQHYRIMAAQER